MRKFLESAKTFVHGTYQVLNAYCMIGMASCLLGVLSHATMRELIMLTFGVPLFACVGGLVLWFCLDFASQPHELHTHPTTD